MVSSSFFNVATSFSRAALESFRDSRSRALSLISLANLLLILSFSLSWFVRLSKSSLVFLQSSLALVPSVSRRPLSFVRFETCVPRRETEWSLVMSSRSRALRFSLRLLTSLPTPSSLACKVCIRFSRSSLFVLRDSLLMFSFLVSRLLLSSSSCNCLALLFSSSMVLSFLLIIPWSVSPNFSCCTDLLSVCIRRSWYSSALLLEASSSSLRCIICFLLVSSCVSCFDTLVWRLYTSFSARSFSPLALSSSISVSLSLLSVTKSCSYSLVFSTFIRSISILRESIFSSATSMSFSSLSTSCCRFSTCPSRYLTLSTRSCIFLSRSSFASRSESKEPSFSFSRSISSKSISPACIWTTASSGSIRSSFCACAVLSWNAASLASSWLLALSFSSSLFFSSVLASCSAFRRARSAYFMSLSEFRPLISPLSPSMVLSLSMISLLYASANFLRLFSSLLSRSISSRFFALAFSSSFTSTSIRDASLRALSRLASSFETLCVNTATWLSYVLFSSLHML